VAIIIEGRERGSTGCGTCLRPENSYSEANRQIYDALSSLGRRTVIDATMIASVIRRARAQCSRSAAPRTPADPDAPPSVANIEAHAIVVVELARVQDSSARCEQIAAIGYGRPGSGDVRRPGTQ